MFIFLGCASWWGLVKSELDAFLFLMHSTHLGFINQSLPLNVWLVAHHWPMADLKGSITPTSSSSRDWWHLGSLVASFVCLEEKLSFCECCVYLGLCVSVCWVCGPGCISSDKVVLNMFAQGPQKEKGPLTHEGLEPHWLHTHTQSTQIKHSNTESEIANSCTQTHAQSGGQFELGWKRGITHTYVKKKEAWDAHQRARKGREVVSKRVLPFPLSSTVTTMLQTGSWQNDGGTPPRQ